MAFLFIIEGRSVFPNAETLLIPPFKDIWERDKSKNKENALEEFCYIEFISSVKKSNPYRQYEEEKKEIEIRKDVITQKDWEPDELVKQGIDKLSEFQMKASTTYTYYQAAKVAAGKMKDFFLNVDLNERNEKTFNPIYKPTDITKALNDTEKVLTNLKSLERKVEEEIYEETKTKAGKEISFFAKRESSR